jgi:hypothetical protein
MQIGFTDGKLGGYVAWQLFYGYHAQMIGVCPGAGWDLTGDGRYVCEGKEIKIFPEYHAMRHYSKFVNPGWSVVSSTTDGSDLYTVAFRSADSDSVTVVAINKASAAASLNFSVDGFTPAYAIQSVEGGDKSKPVTAAATLEAPAKSITTVVFTSSTTAIKNLRADLASDMNATAKIFDLNGNLVWIGLKNAAMNADGTLRLNIRQGMYLVKTKSSTIKAMKK